MRMNAGFEMSWCDFESDTLRLVEHMNVTAPLLHGLYWKTLLKMKELLLDHTYHYYLQ